MRDDDHADRTRPDPSRWRSCSCWRSRRRGVPSAGRRARAPILWSAARHGHVYSHHERHSRPGHGAAGFAPFVQQFGLRATPLLMIPAIAACCRCCDAYQRSIDCRSITKPEASPRSAVRAAADIALLDRRAANVDCHELLDIRPCSADQTRSFTRAGRNGVSIYLIAVGLGGFIGGPSADRFGPRRVIILSLVSSVPFLIVAPMLHGGRSSSCSPSGVPAAIDAAGQRHVCAAHRANQRSNGVLAHDGLRMGHGGSACRWSA